MSDFYNNGANTNNTNQTNQYGTNQNQTGTSTNNGTYSYTKGQINQGESYYQWTPYDDGKKNKKAKKQGGFAGKVGRAAVIALVFGLIAGISFQSVVLVSNKVFKVSSNKTAIESTETADTSDNSGALDSTASGSTVSTTITSDVSSIAESVLPAIVQVTNVGLKEYQTLFGTVSQEATSAGSGIIISQDDDNIYIDGVKFEIEKLGRGEEQKIPVIKENASGRDYFTELETLSDKVRKREEEIKGNIFLSPDDDRELSDYLKGVYTEMAKTRGELAKLDE